MFTSNINLGSVLTICTILAISVGFGRRFGIFEQSLSDIIKSFNSHEANDERRFANIERQLDMLRDRNIRVDGRG